jgi:FkbM family methyltransferase
MLKKIHGHFNYIRGIRVKGRSFRVPIINNMGMANLQVAENWFTRMLQKINLPPGSAFVDVGVNVGQTLLTFRSVSGNPYFGFEPNPSCVYYLQKLISENRFENTSIIPVGLFSESKVASFFQKNSSDAAGTVEDKLRPGYYEKNEVSYVPVFAFDQLSIDSLNNVSLVKIDVEGAELGVLKGMSNLMMTQRPVVICEVLDYHSEDSRVQMQAKATELAKLVHSWNYRMSRITAGTNNVRIEPISEIQLKQWDTESWSRNDYLLVPAERTDI